MFDLIKRNLLKYTLLVDGIVSVAAGVTFLTLSGVIAELIGPAFTGSFVLALGTFLLPWGLFHLAMSSHAEAPAGGVRIAIIGDALWVLGSVAVLVVDWNGLTAVGAACITAMTVAVADIMLLKLRGFSDQRRTVVA